MGWDTRVGRKTVQTSLALGERVEYEEEELHRRLQSRGPKVGVRSKCLVVENGVIATMCHRGLLFLETP